MMIDTTLFETEAEREEREATEAGAWVAPWTLAEVEDEEAGYDGPCCPDAWVASRRLCGCWR